MCPARDSAILLEPLERRALMSAAFVGPPAPVAVVHAVHRHAAAASGIAGTYGGTASGTVTVFDPYTGDSPTTPFNTKLPSVDVRDLGNGEIIVSANFPHPAWNGDTIEFSEIFIQKLVKPSPPEKPYYIYETVSGTDHFTVTGNKFTVSGKDSDGMESVNFKITATKK